jgi:hypothetical protein
LTVSGFHLQVDEVLIDIKSVCGVLHRMGRIKKRMHAQYGERSDTRDKTGSVE